MIDPAIYECLFCDVNKEFPVWFDVNIDYVYVSCGYKCQIEIASETLHRQMTHSVNT